MYAIRSYYVIDVLADFTRLQLHPRGSQPAQRLIILQRGFQIDRALQLGGQGHGILHRHTGALREILQHRMRRIAQQRHTPVDPRITSYNVCYTKLLRGSWFLPTMNRDARAGYDAAHIPGARFFDIDEIADSRSELPHMAPPVEKFVSRMRAMGVGDGHQVVVYDQMGVFSAPRVWWTFRNNFV